MAAGQGRKALVELRIDAPRAGHAARVLREAAREMLAKGPRNELSLSLVTDRSMRALNRRWRKKDKPTDVLSFPLAPPGGTGPLGDVVISLDTARRQAADGGWSLKLELRRLLAHGIVHCLGYDHEGHPRDAWDFADLEKTLLGGHEGMVGASYSMDRAKKRIPSRRKKR